MKHLKQRAVLIFLGAVTTLLPAAAGESLTAPARSAALDAIRKAIDEHYVIPASRAAIISRLNEGQSAGHYETGDADLFAERVTADLKDSGHDGHLWLRVDAAAYAAALAPQADGAEEKALWRKRALRNNHGLAEMRILPGNVRYLKITEFAWVRDETGSAYDAAMRFLREGDAVIIDLRGNGGGWHAPVRYLVSHFLEEDTLEFVFQEAGKQPEQSRTLGHLPAGRMLGKPLYVLISERVGSAAEAFAYDVQQFRLGQLVGERTGGAANNNLLLPVAPLFTLSVSNGRGVHAVSGSNWEGSGVEPTHKVAAAQALEAAHRLALQALAQGEAPDGEHAWALVAAEARLNPPTAPFAKPDSLSGRYGRASIESGGGQLTLRLPGRPAARLNALSGDGLFAIEGSDMQRVRLDGRSIEVWKFGEANPRTFRRDGSLK